MKVESVVEVLCAAHLSSLVDSPFDGLGGIFLVGPPEAFKTTMLLALRQYPNALMLTDINSQALAKLRDQIASRTIRSIVMLDFQKIYERDSDTANNVEGNIRALASEGFRGASFQPHGINRVNAQCVVLGAMTPALMEARFERWKGTGFARRFLFSTFVLDDPEAITRAILKWEKIELGRRFIVPPINGFIPNTVTEKERHKLHQIIRYQYGRSETLTTIVRIYAVLKWFYAEKGQTERAMEVIEDFGASLGEDGAMLELGESTKNGKRKSSKSKSNRGRGAVKGVSASKNEGSGNSASRIGAGVAGELERPTGS